MTKINIQQLGAKSNEARAFLEAKLKENLSVGDGVIEVEGHTKSSLRVYLKKFLHRNGLDDRFRVLANKSEIRVSKIKKAK